jgi:hypothetical protein
MYCHVFLIKCTSLHLADFVIPIIGNHGNTKTAIEMISFIDFC